MTVNELEKTVNSSLTTAIKTSKINFGHLIIDIDVKDLSSTILFLKTNAKCKFKQLIDITAVDYPKRAKRFELVYILLSLKNKLRIRVKVFLSENENIPSITSIYKSAAWYEREVWDMYGISFKNNVDLRRILTDYGFEGFPLRKDFPLTGFVELRYDDSKKKVSYSKVKLTQDYRNFDFLSPWEGGTLPGDEKADK